MNHITPIIEIVEPKELIRFHPAKLSAKSDYRLGRPAKPKKCCGKKVKFTPINISQKRIFSYTSL